MLNRRELAKHFRNRGFKKGAEVGVHMGYYSRVLLDTIEDLDLMLIDSWCKHEARRRALELVKEIFTEERYPGATIIQKESVEAAKEVEDESLDFVYIDAAHDYENVKADIEAWWPKVRKGGILAGHDYIESRSGRVGVIPAVDEFVLNNHLHLSLTDYDKRNPHNDDKQPTWYITKPIR